MTAGVLGRKAREWCVRLVEQHCMCSGSALSGCSRGAVWSAEVVERQCREVVNGTVEGLSMLFK